MVRRAFRALGHDAWSCDLLPAEDGSEFHIEGDAFSFYALGERAADWDLVVAHPPCTDLAVSGARWFPAKRASGEQQRSIDFFMRFANCKCPKVAIENPISIMSTVWRKPDQVIQPWQFGHGEVKATCLWLKGLPKLEPTKIVSGREARVHKMPPGPNRWRERSRTLRGIAEAMADQWSRPVPQMELYETR